jgi:protein TonB
MTWQDDEFERYLRQFQLRRPRPLPVRPLTPIVLAVAALVALAIVIPLRMPSSQDGVPSAGQGAAPTKSSEASAPRSAGGVATSPAVPGVTGVKPGFVAASGSVSAAKRVRVGGAVKPPRRVHNVDPEYPQEAQAARIEGVVVLDIVVGVDGSVIQIDVVKSIPELDQAAIDAVSRWRYETTLLNGEPVEVAMNVTINFTLV